MPKKEFGTTREELSTTEARQGVRRPTALRVLLISTLAAFAALVLLYFLFWPWPSPDTQPVEKPAETQSAPEAIPPAAPPAQRQPGQPPPAQQ